MLIESSEQRTDATRVRPEDMPRIIEDALLNLMPKSRQATMSCVGSWG